MNTVGRTKKPLSAHRCGPGRPRRAARPRAAQSGCSRPAAAIPERLIRDISLIGPISFVHERVAVLREVGVVVLSAQLHNVTHEDQLRSIERLAEIVSPA
jgi:hypothetical protein